MLTIAIESLDDGRVDAYRDVRDADHRRAGRFLVEGRLNARRLIEEARYRALSALVTPTAFEAMRDCLAKLPQGAPVFVAAQTVLNDVVGYNIHRGCLLLAERGEAISFDALTARESALVVALDDLSDQENVGGVLRNAMAFGVDAVLLSPRCCDPLMRKSLRVSMGGALRVPHLRARSWPGDLDAMRDRGFEVVGLEPTPDALPVETLAHRGRRLVLVAGAEVVT